MIYSIYMLMYRLYGKEGVIMYDKIRIALQSMDKEGLIEIWNRYALSSDNGESRYIYTMDKLNAFCKGFTAKEILTMCHSFFSLYNMI